MNNLISNIMVRVINDCDYLNIKAYATVTIAGVIKLRGIKIVNGSKGLFIAYPSYLRQDGQFQEIYMPVDKMFRKDLQDAVLAEYEKELVSPKQPVFQA